MYPWARDAAGNISEKSSSNTKKVTIIKPDKEAPKVNAFDVISPSYSMNVKIDKIKASDDASGVASYCIKEGSAADTSSSYSDCVWKSWPKGKAEITDVIYEAKTEGIKTLFVWVKDGKEKISETTSTSRKIVAVWNYVSGSCEGFVVRNVDAPQSKWASGGIVDDHCEDPQCSNDPGVLVASNSVEFFKSAFLSNWKYDARQACKDVGGRLPSIAELQCIKSHKNEFGTFADSNYWSNVEEKKAEQGGCTKCDGGLLLFGFCFKPGTCTAWKTIYTYENAINFNMNTGISSASPKDSSNYVRCVH